MKNRLSLQGHFSHAITRVLSILIVAALMILTLGTMTTRAASEASDNAPPASTEPNQIELLQFTSGGHVLAFASDKAYLAGLDNALTVTFVDSQAVTPVGVSSGQTESLAASLGTVTYPGLWPGIDLHTLQHGDQIIIQAFGQKHVYEVREVIQVRADDLRALPHSEYDMLTLITCQGYDEASGEYDWRLAVRAVLINIK